MTPPPDPGKLIVAIGVLVSLIAALIYARSRVRARLRKSGALRKTESEKERDEKA